MLPWSTLGRRGVFITSTTCSIKQQQLLQHQQQRLQLMLGASSIVPVTKTSARSFSSSSSNEARPPFPPFTLETAKEKVQKAEAAWNTRDPHTVSLAYTIDSHWRNRDEFLQGREAIKAFLTKKWKKEQDYCLMKELWTFHGNRISARFEYEWHDGQGQWYRSHGNEQWEFDEKGLMKRRDASINDVKIKENERRYVRNAKTGLVEYPQGHP